MHLSDTSSELFNRDASNLPIVESAPVGLFQTDVEGNCLYVNAKWRQLSGMSLEAALGKGWIAALHPDDRDRVAAEWYRAAQEEREFQSDYRFQTRDGTATWLHGTAVALRNNSGEIIGYVGTVTDITARQSAENRLQLREKELQLATDHAPVGIAHCSRDERFLFVNRAYARRFGKSPEELIGKSISDVLGKKAQESIQQYVTRVLTGERVEFEIEIPFDQLGSRLMQCAYEPEVDSNAEVLGWIAVVLDVTERRKAEAELIQSEHRFAQFMEHLPGLAWIKDLQGRYIYANDAAVDVFGVTRQNLFGKSDHEIFDSITAAQFKEHDWRALASAGGIQVVEMLANRAGELRSSLVSKFVIPGADHKPAFIGGMAIDITDRLNAESDLRRNKDRLELAQRAGRIGTFDWNIKTNDVEWSAMEEELYGLPAGSFGGQLENWKKTLHPDDRERAITDCEFAVREKADLVAEFRIIRPDGQIRWIFAQGKIVCDNNGEPQRMIGVNMDVTDQKQAEAALREADRRKDEFLATLAHELRNPLAPLQHSLQLLRNPDSDRAQAYSLYDVMARQVHHLGRLVDDLLEVSRITSGKIELRLEKIDIADVIRQAIETSRTLIDSAGVSFASSVPSEKLFVEGDSVRLSQVFTNLLNNAAKYTNQGGSVWIGAERERDEVVIRVRDTGIGISAEMLPKVFDLFAQSEKVFTRSHGGLGIGLTLVRGLVQLHGGTVTVHSDGLGKGSEFDVRLPSVSAPSAAKQLPQIDSKKLVGTRRILIVDDNVDAATTLGAILRVLGADVQLAHDGPSALSVIDQFRPDMILLDLGMPEMDGYEVAKRIRKRHEFNDIKLVALTGWGQEEDRRRTQQAGFDHHLVKPAELSVLRALLQ
jgi:PAS domain S-box-containing protein